MVLRKGSMYLARLVGLVFLFIATNSCSSFLPSGNGPYQAREKECELIYLSKAPENGSKYVVLGYCNGRGIKGIIRSEYEAAHKRVENCACKNGGNAIILNTSYSEGTYDQYGRYTQFNVVVSATVIYIEKE